MGPGNTWSCKLCGYLTPAGSMGVCNACLKKGLDALAELEKLKAALKRKIDHSTWFYKNCKIQRRKGAKICNSCPFRILIEATE